MLLDAEDCQLILIDYQQRLMPALHDHAAVLANAWRLAQGARLFSVPIVGTEQMPDKLGATLEPLRSSYNTTVVKHSFSAAPQLLPHLAPKPVAEPPRGNARSLPRHLRQPAAEPQVQRPVLVLAGCEAHVCLLQTALELLEQEWDVCVVTDACTSRSERNRDAAFDRLAAAGAELLSTEMVLFEWLGTAEHPDFKAVQALVK